MIELRDYQKKAIDDITQAAVDGNRKILLQLPTGAGKTVVASRIIQHAVSNSNKVLFLAHRRELIYQTLDKLQNFNIEASAMLSGDIYVTAYPVIVASIATINSWVVRRRKEFQPPADLVIVDECHHVSGSKTWQGILNLYPQSIILGMTATPISKTGKGLAAHFDTLVCGPSIRELTDMGYLVPARYFAPSTPDLAGVKIRQGDYAEDQLEARMNQPKLIGDILENWSILAPGKKTVVFATGVKHSQHLAESFNAVGIKAVHIDGRTPPRERDQLLREFSEGKIQVLCNCAVFTEGWDCPAVECLVFARPTKSLLLYLQVAGRVLRPSPGKNSCTILDHSGVIDEHGFLSEPRDWALTLNKEQPEIVAQRKKARERKTINCKKCKAVYEGQLECPSCGTKPDVKGKYVDTYEAYLVALDELEVRRRTINEQEFYQMLIGYALAHNKKPGLAFYKFQAKFGKKPPYYWRDLPPITPSLEVNSWIRSQNIRYAHRIQKTKTYKKPENNIGSFAKIPSHGYERIDKLAGDGYVREMDMEEPFGG